MPGPRLLSACLAAALLTAPLPGAAQEPDHACARDIQKFVTFRDPDSVKVVSVSQGTFEVISSMDRRIAAVKHTVLVNSKGPQGGYAGARAYQCWTSEDRQRVLDYKPKRD